MKRIIALTLCLVLCMGLCVNVFAANENNTKGVVFSVELDKPNLTVSDEDQTVRMTFTANKEFETCSVSYTASTDEFPVTALKGGANMPAATVNPVTKMLSWNSNDGNVALARALHEQVEALKNHGDVAPGRAKLCLAEGRHVAAVDDDLAAGRPLEHVDAADEGALARAAHADDAVDFAVRDGQRHIFQRLRGPAGCGKRLGQVLYLDHLVPPTYRNNAVSISPSALFP